MDARSSSTSVRVCASAALRLLRRPQRVHFLHQFQLAGFEIVRFLFITRDLVAQRLVFLVLAGFKLLVLEPLDGRAAGAGVEFETFQAQLAIDQRVVGAGDGGLVACQFGFRPGLVLTGSFSRSLASANKRRSRSWRINKARTSSSMRFA
jgi:hypothetical protein